MSQVGFRSALSAYSKSYLGTVTLTERGSKSSFVHTKVTCHILATVKANSSPPLTISEPQLYRAIKYPQNGIWVFFSCCYGKIIHQRQIKGERVISMHSSKVQAIAGGCHGNRSLREQVTLHPWLRSREWWLYAAAQLSFLFQVRIPARKWYHKHCACPDC